LAFSNLVDQLPFFSLKIGRENEQINTIVGCLGDGKNQEKREQVEQTRTTHHHFGMIRRLQQIQSLPEHNRPEIEKRKLNSIF
jgi:hypothetical protein